jgi:hypothetical protein
MKYLELENERWIRLNYETFVTFESYENENPFKLEESVFSMVS